MFIFLGLLVIAAIGYGFIYFLIKALNPNADFDTTVWASLLFGALVFVFFGFLYLVAPAF
ncbi:hypothetical protein B9G55_00800 [Saccharibacillus sp. O16]|nr:hypothetical protein B9G55_00800 [Saccharibacillus sp. O16]